MKSKRDIGKKKKTLIIIISIAVVILIAGLVFLRDRLVCDYSYPGDGWTCKYSDFIKVTPGLELKYRTKCLTQNGEFSTGYIQPSGGRYYSCFIPFSDYGQKCNYSEECKGSCKYQGTIPAICNQIEKNKYSCSEDVEGICSEEKLGSCDTYKEVEGNIIYDNKPHCIF